MRQIHAEHDLENHLKQLGWCVFHPQQHPLAVQIAVYRQATTIAGFEGSALHGLTFLGNVDDQVTLLFLGDSPSVDYFLQFRAQGFRGHFIACSEVDHEDPRPAHLQSRRLRLDPEALARQIETMI